MYCISKVGKTRSRNALDHSATSRIITIRIMTVYRNYTFETKIYPGSRIRAFRPRILANQPESTCNRPNTNHREKSQLSCQHLPNRRGQVVRLIRVHSRRFAGKTSFNAHFGFIRIAFPPRRKGAMVLLGGGEFRFGRNRRLKFNQVWPFVSDSRYPRRQTMGGVAA